MSKDTIEHARSRAISRAKGRYNNFRQSYIDYCDQCWIQKIRTDCISPICIRLNPPPTLPPPPVSTNDDSIINKIDDCVDDCVEENKQPDLELIRSESKTSMTAFIIFWMNVLHIMGCLHFLVILRRNNWYVHLCVTESVWM